MRRPKSYHIEDSDSPNELEAQKAKWATVARLAIKLRINTNPKKYFPPITIQVFPKNK